MNQLRVRVYNVRFGDAILISVPDSAAGEPRLRHILIDVGNALTGEGGKDFLFKGIVEDIQRTIGEDSIDLYILTHEHMDHIQGLFYAAAKEDVPKLPVDKSWLTASAAPDYYERDWPEDRTPKKHLAIYDAIEQFAEARKHAGNALPLAVRAMLLNNNPRRSADCVNYLRQLATGDTEYVHRGSGATHPFEVAELDVWAPEENTAVYYGRFRPMMLGVEGGPIAGEDEPPTLTNVLPPRGVDAGSFYQLVAARRRGYVDNLLAIDKSKNNSSVVFCLKWHGWKLLFPGDAEIRSWKEMDRHAQLEPIHFLKISHHLSHNGTPSGALLEKILPMDAPDGKQRMAVASTYPGVYSGIPDVATVDRLSEREMSTVTVHEALAALSDDQSATAGYVDFLFPPDGDNIGVVATPFTAEPAQADP